MDGGALRRRQRVERFSALLASSLVGRRRPGGVGGGGGVAAHAPLGLRDERAADGERADRAAERGNHIRSMMENSAAAKVAAGDDVTRWRASARLAGVRG